MNTPQRRPPAGFTLIELMIVVFIIALLTATLVSIIPRVKRAVYAAQTQAQMVAISTACQSYFNDFRAYPGPLPNSQVGTHYYSYPSTPQSTGVYVLDPNNSNAPVTLELLTGSLGSEVSQGTLPSITYVTGAENLFLGLIGGLELDVDPTSGKITHFAYSDASIYPDGKTATPLGPMSLNPASPKRLGAYLQVKNGDLSNSRASGIPTVFTDEGGRSATDSPIPEFLDKFSNPMPILYLRANVGGTAVVGVGGQDDSGNKLQGKDAGGNPTYPVPQYDLAGLVGYTRAPTSGTPIGINPSDVQHNHHGLKGVGPMITDTVAADYANATNPGYNGAAYFKDPNNPSTSNTPDYSKSPALLGNARQKDAFILISAGPDGIYGTADDIIVPGGPVGN